MRSAAAVQSDDGSRDEREEIRCRQKKASVPLMTMGDEELGLLDVVFLDAIASRDAAWER